MIINPVFPVLTKSGEIKTLSLADSPHANILEELQQKADECMVRTGFVPDVVFMGWKTYLEYEHILGAPDLTMPEATWNGNRIVVVRSPWFLDVGFSRPDEALPAYIQDEMS